MNDRSFQGFLDQVETLLTADAAAKGYSGGGPDAANPLFEFVTTLTETAGGISGHGLGAAVYKLQRYGAKRQAIDLVKCAAWCFLLWRFHPDRGDQ